MTVNRARSLPIRQPFRMAGLLLATWLLSSCALMRPVEQQQSAPVKQTALPKPTPVAVEPAKVAILISQDLPEFVSIANTLAEQFGDGNYSLHHLKGRVHYTSRVLKEVEASDADQLVAIGLLAARVARKQSTRPVVFCQTYNYQEHNLISAESKGVSFLPPFDQQFASWKMLAPNLQHVGIVTGPNQAEILKEIRQAAGKRNIEIVSRTVTSDKEALLETRRMIAELEAILLLPDNRVLSPGVLREIMATGTKRHTQIAVYSPGLLDLGALISFTGTAEDIAANVIARLKQVDKSGQLSGPALRPLSALEVQVNPEVARNLSLVIPKQLSMAGRR
jgi:ABC-type uncharacterized transport system substrate-binding protein